jgi:hypothetical protein
VLKKPWRKVPVSGHAAVAEVRHKHSLTDVMHRGRFEKKRHKMLLQTGPGMVWASPDGASEMAWRNPQIRMWAFKVDGCRGSPR